jgi:hypothetical protein
MTFKNPISDCQTTPSPKKGKLDGAILGYNGFFKRITPNLKIFCG